MCATSTSTRSRYDSGGSPVFVATPSRSPDDDHDHDHDHEMQRRCGAGGLYTRGTSNEATDTEGLVRLGLPNCIVPTRSPGKKEAEEEKVVPRFQLHEDPMKCISSIPPQEGEILSEISNWNEMRDRNKECIITEIKYLRALIIVHKEFLSS